MSYIVVGIHTGIGKTVCSAILTEALQCDYWKPVQAGSLRSTDTHFVKRMIDNDRSVLHDEAYRLKLAASPHYAAEFEGIEISLNKIRLPKSENGIIVETAGGLLSPLSRRLSNLDVVKKLKLPVILVSNNYLGSINHTMLTLEVLQESGATMKGIIFWGKSFDSTREYILKKSRLPLLLEVPYFRKLTRKTLCEFADKKGKLIRSRLS